jgi:hypothetical protein
MILAAVRLHCMSQRLRCAIVQELNIGAVVSSVEPLEDRETDSDVRRGDTFIFRIQEDKCPVGGVWIVPDHPHESIQERAWNEIVESFTQGRIIRGRVLNTLPSGFAVGIAGYVGLMPIYASDPRKVRRLGTLQEFVLTRVLQDETFFVAHVGMEGRPAPSQQSNQRAGRYLRMSTPHTWASR